MPYKRKFLQPIQFKKAAIKYSDGFLELSLAKGYGPIKVRWNDSLPIPKFATICWKKGVGWQLNCVIEKNVETIDLDPDKVMGVDLGVKRIAATFDGGNCVTYSGKLIRSLIRLRNKMNAETQMKLSRLKKGGRKSQRIKYAHRKVVRRIDNKIKDILHKTSRTMVNEAIQGKVSTLVFGDCSDIHNQTNLGHVNNQQVQQSPEQKLRNYVQYKFESVGGIVATVPEHYTTQTCPRCGHRHKPQTRMYHCPICDFIYDRDGVGAVNLRSRVSSDFKLDVVGGLTLSRGWKYQPPLPCFIAKQGESQLL